MVNIDKSTILKNFTLDKLKISFVMKYKSEIQVWYDLVIICIQNKKRENYLIEKFCKLAIIFYFYYFEKFYMYL